MAAFLGPRPTSQEKVQGLSTRLRLRFAQARWASTNKNKNMHEGLRLVLTWNSRTSGAGSRDLKGSPRARTPSFQWRESRPKDNNYTVTKAQLLTAPACSHPPPANLA